MADQKRVIWVCPLCRTVVSGGGSIKKVDVCDICRSRPDWEALPQAVRDEVGAMADAGDVNNAVHRLRDLDHNRLDPWTCTLMVAYQNRRNSSGSIPRNAS
ncbi:hypothetical protein ACFOWZ_07535 [Lentzea rhizosphaerae]|uniref:Cysteine-rich CPCC domain-containing protein n=1 Tax=Lentzea rhizosphaerae TaxID=2041025 RepID=A0ABV8BNY7_9PSEU